MPHSSNHSLSDTEALCVIYALTFVSLLQLEDGGTLLAENQEDLGAPAIAAHIRSLTEPRSEEECQV